MRILHISDLHLDSPLTARLPAGRVRERKAELFATFRALSAEAQRLGCRCIIIAGDLFDSERVSRRSAERVLSVIESYRELDYLYLPGNHERQALSALCEAMPDNLKIFTEGWSFYDYGEVRIGGATDTYEGMCRDFPAREGVNLAVLHGVLAEKGQAGGFIGSPDLEASRIDYLALGHYHSYGVYELKGGRCAVYCGTPEGRGFDEVGRKGYVLIDIENGGVRHKFCPFAKRTLHSVTIDLSAAEMRSELYSVVESNLISIPEKDLVSVRLVGRHSPALSVEAETLYASFKDRFYYFEIRDESRLRIDKEDYVRDKSLKGEFIRAVCADEDLTECEREDIIRLGLSALLGDLGEV